MSQTPAKRRQLRERDSLSTGSTMSSGSSSSSSSSSSGTAVGAKIRTRLSTGTLVMNGTSTVKEKDTRTPLSTPGSDSSKILTDKSATGSKRRVTSAEAAAAVPPKQRKISRSDGRVSDQYCWLCHKDECSVTCQLCPRSFHLKCLMLAAMPGEWVCAECEKIMDAECMDTRSKAMRQITTDTLSLLLRYALDRMRQPGSEVFQKPANLVDLPLYSDVIVNPMDFSMLEKNIKKKEYGCTEAFLADAKWILHNCIIYNGLHHKLTAVARNVVKSCKHEVTEIEVCPQCYKHSCIKGELNWFIEPCDPPHPLVWAKLKGYPFWPAKAMEETSGGIDVRFFGAHDKSVIPVSHVFMLSKDPPTTMSKKKGGFSSAMEEVEEHIKVIRAKYGTFDFAPFRTPYDRGQVYMSNKLKGVNMMAAKRFKVAAHGRFAVKGKEAEKVSAISKTASAVKSKYSSLASKKFTPVTITFPVTSTKPVQPPPQSLRPPPSSPDTAEKAIRQALSDCGRTAASKSRFINPIVSVTDIIQQKMQKRRELETEADLEGTETESGEDNKSVARTAMLVKNSAEKQTAKGVLFRKDRDAISKEKPAEDETAEERNEGKETVTTEGTSLKHGSHDGTEVHKTTEAHVATEKSRLPLEKLEEDTRREVIDKNETLGDMEGKSIKGSLESTCVSNEQHSTNKEDEEKLDNRKKMSEEKPPADNRQTGRSDDRFEHNSVTVKGIQEEICVELSKKENRTDDSDQEKNKNSTSDGLKIIKPVTSLNPSTCGLSKISDSKGAVPSEDVARDAPDSTSERTVTSSAPCSPKASNDIVTTTVSPQSGVEYRDSLLKTIEACKGKLGITCVEDMDIPMEVSDEDESLHSKDTQGRDGESETVADSQISTDSQDSRMSSEIDVDMSSTASNLPGRTLDSGKDSNSVMDKSVAQNSSAGDREETGEKSPDAEASLASSDVTILPSSSVSGVNRETKPTEDLNRSQRQVVHFEVCKGINADKAVVSCSAVSEVCEEDTTVSTSSLQSNVVTHCVAKPSDFDVTTDRKIAEASSVLDKAAEKWNKLVSEFDQLDKAGVSKEHKTLSTFSAQVSSSVSSEPLARAHFAPVTESDPCHGGERREVSLVSSQPASKSLQPKSETSTETPSGNSRINPITINDDDEPTLLMEVESAEGEDEALIIDLDEDSETNANDTTIREKSSGFVKELGPSAAVLKKLWKSSSNVPLKKKRKRFKKKEKGLLAETSSLAVSSSSGVAALSEPCEMMISDVRSLSGTIHDWKEDDGKGSSLPPRQPQPPPPVPVSLLQQQSPPQLPPQAEQKLSQQRERQRPSYQVLRQQLQQEPLPQASQKQQQQQAGQPPSVQQVQQQLQETVQQSVHLLQDQRGSQHAVQQPVVTQSPSQPLSAAATAVLDPAHPLLLRNFRMPPTSPVEHSQSNTASPATVRMASTSQSDPSSSNKDATTTSSQSSTPAEESQLSETYPSPALTPAAVSLVNKYSQQIVGNMQLQLAEMSKELLSSTTSERGEEQVREEREQLLWNHAVQMTEVQHSHKLTIAEMKACWEAEMSKALADLKKKMTQEKEEAVMEAKKKQWKKMTLEKEEAVENTKKKQWCASCWKEALYYCCWNTSYCSYDCQQQHWGTHQQHCRQILDDSPPVPAPAPTPTPLPTTTPFNLPGPSSTSTVMVASPAATGYVSVKPTGTEKNVQTILERSDGVLTQKLTVQKPGSGTVNILQGGDMWRNRLPQNIQLISQLAGSSPAVRLPPGQSRPVPPFHYIRSVAPGAQPAFQPNSLLRPLTQVVGQRPLGNTSLPSSTMMFPIMLQPVTTPSSNIVLKK